MTFRQRLGLFLIITLVGVQGVTALLAYSVVRGNLVNQGKLELQATTAVFMRQLQVLSERVSDDVSVLSLDYALRKAVAEHDSNTALSALRNHGGRIGATRMLLIGLDGKITADTTRADMIGTNFPFTDLLNDAASSDEGTALAVLDGAIYWIVVVPVKAPVPIAFIAAGVPVDAALLEQLRGLSATPHSLALATIGAKGGWTMVSHSAGAVPKLPKADDMPPIGAVVAADDNADRLSMTARLKTADKSQPVIAVLDYPIEEALSAYRSVITPMLFALAGALLVAMAGAVLIARGVSRPIEVLASAAQRIAAGDYSSTPQLKRADEIGQLSTALTNMTHSIAERETALVGAVNSLELARNDAVRASEAKSQFLSNMSHELRTPLNAIIGFAEMIHRQIIGPVGVPRYAEYARHIDESGRHLLSQVNEMLDLAETSAGKMSITRERFAPGSILRGVMETLGPVAAKASVRIEVRGDPSSWPPIEGDGPKLGQGIKNLLHNAIKFTPAGGTVTIAGEACDTMLLIRISDTGIGIFAEDIPLVVLPFHRRKKAFDGSHQGAGIGLPFAKAILELHGGRLDIESTPGAGTTVTIALPLASETAPHSIENAA